MEACPFTPPNRAALWASLALNRPQLAALCGLSVRQVDYWTARGGAPSRTCRRSGYGKPRRRPHEASPSPRPARAP